jgi:hypothetical protein
MSKRRLHHHGSEETIRAERDVARLLQRIEAEHTRFGHHPEDAARRRGRASKIAGVVLMVAALAAIVGTIAWSFR